MLQEQNLQEIHITIYFDYNKNHFKHLGRFLESRIGEKHPIN